MTDYEFNEHKATPEVDSIGRTLTIPSAKTTKKVNTRETAAYLPQRYHLVWKIHLKYEI